MSSGAEHAADIGQLAEAAGDLRLLLCWGRPSPMAAGPMRLRSGEPRTSAACPGTKQSICCACCRRSGGADLYSQILSCDGGEARVWAGWAAFTDGTHHIDQHYVSSWHTLAEGLCMPLARAGAVTTPLSALLPGRSLRSPSRNPLAPGQRPEFCLGSDQPGDLDTEVCRRVSWAAPG